MKWLLGLSERALGRMLLVFIIAHILLNVLAIVTEHKTPMILASIVAGVLSIGTEIRKRQTSQPYVRVIEPHEWEEKEAPRSAEPRPLYFFTIRAKDHGKGHTPVFRCDTWTDGVWEEVGVHKKIGVNGDVTITSNSRDRRRVVIGR